MTGTKSHQKVHLETLSPIKVAPPRQTVSLLERKRLLTELDNSRKYLVTVIQAPAGYGKTSLLSQWHEQELKKGNHVVWLTLDESHNDEHLLISYLIFAFIDAGYEDKESFSNDNLSKGLLSKLTNSIAATGKHFTLILDQFEALGGTVIESVIAELLRVCPDNLHLIICGRKTAPLGISKLMMQGQARLLDPTGFPFTLQESLDLLTDLFSKTDISQVHSETLGWPVAVLYVKMKMKSDNTIALGDLYSEFTHYIEENITSSFSPEEYDFLCKTSLVEMITPGLANKILEISDSQRLLDDFIHRNSLLITQHKESSGYFIHPLLREFFSRKLNQFGLETTARLHINAARWYAESKQLLPAVLHYTQAGDFESACQAIEIAGGISLFLIEGMANLFTIHHTLYSHWQHLSPKVKVLCCLALLKEGNFSDAEEHLREILRDEDAITRQRGEAYSLELRGDCRFLKEILQSYQGGKQFNIDEIEFEEPLEVGSDIYAGHVKTVMCRAHLDRGSFQYAIKCATEALLSFQQANSIYGGVFIYLHYANACLATGDTAAAKNHLKTAYRIISTHFNTDQHIRLIYRVINGELLFELGGSPSHQSIASIPNELEHGDAWADLILCGFILAANFINRKTGYEEARKILEKGIALGRRNKLEQITNALSIHMVYLAINAEKRDEAEKLLHNITVDLERHLDPLEKKHSWREREVIISMQLRLLLSDKAFQKAIDLAELASNKLADILPVRFKQYLAITEAIAYFSLKDDRKFSDALELALSIYKQTGIKKPFIDYGKLLYPICLEGLKSSRETHLGNLLESTIKLLPYEVVSDADKEGLSDKEVEVLQLVSMGLPNKIIARKLDITAHTVKYHLNKVFAKLAAKNRTDAVNIAREKGVL